MSQPNSSFDIKKTIIPVLLGLGMGAFIAYRYIELDQLAQLDFSDWTLYAFLAIALLSIVGRVGAYVWRIRILTDGYLSLKRAFQVICLWEFGSAVTPGIVGGSAVAVYLLKKEGLALGRSTAIVLLTAFLDELLFICLLPLIFVVIGPKLFFITELCPDLAEYQSFFDWMSGSLAYSIIAVYFILVAITIALGYGLLVRPTWMRQLLHAASTWPILKRWSAGFQQTGNDIVTTAEFLRSKGRGFWAKAMLSTLLTWSSRFLLANVLIFAVGGLFSESFAVYGRQFAIWMIMLIPTTPGGSLLAETSFMIYLCEYVPDGMIGATTLLWRLLSYYVFLIIGVIVLPQWWRRVQS